MAWCLINTIHVLHPCDHYVQICAKLMEVSNLQTHLSLRLRQLLTRGEAPHNASETACELLNHSWMLVETMVSQQAAVNEGIRY